MGILVLAVNVLSVVGVLYYAFAKAETQSIIFMGLAIKLVVDVILIATEASFYNRKRYLKWYPVVMVCYPFISTYIALRSLTTGYQWKGRNYKQ
jgi:hypothetical protein